MVAKPDPCAAAAAAPLNCPRCDSANTKFCYYNNYSLAQPRHFCKSCKRYWTRGGTLRNVPVGGGCRKNKRAKKSHPSAPAAAGAAAGAAPSLPPPRVADHSPAAADLSSLLYGFPPMMNSSSTVFFPKFEIDGQIGGGYEESFGSGYSLLSSQIPSHPLLSYDDLNGGSGNRSINAPLELGANAFVGSGGSGAAAQMPSYVFWNQGMSGGWGESGSSLAPLI